MANFSDIAGPFSSALGGKSFPASYPFAKRFVSNSNTNEGSGNNAVTALDDPTYLGFSLMFDILSPLFNGAQIGDPPAAIPPVIEPPATKLDTLAGNITGGLNDLKSKIGDSLGISGFGGATVGSIDGDTTNTAALPPEPSAVGYLLKVGENQRAKYLQAFIQGIQEVVKTRPYYFQTIAGLLEAWGKSTDFAIDPYTGVDAKDGITIGCLEAIDLKITGLFNLYRMAIYDERMKRFVVPKNLMRFDVYVDVHEIRRFVTTRNWLKALNTGDGSPESAKYVNENTSRVRFKFTECTFDPAASGKVFESVTNTGGTVASTEMKFGYGVMELQSSYSGFDSSLDVTKPQITTNPSLTSKISSFGKDLVDNAVQGVANKLTSTVNSAIQGITLGNVFGLRNELLGTLANPQGLLNAALGAAAQSNELQTFGGSTANTSLGDNPLGDAAAPLQSIGSSSAFDPSTNSFGELKTINAYGAPGPTQSDGGLSSTNIFE
jgi:hypothetical protein|tara:strand:- start:3045 stop:4520 length:1476 start_codon:yes stop_codon:yes gene_type:complete